MNVHDVHVVVTTDFVRTVAQVTREASYTAARGAGVVAARLVR